MGIVEPFRTTGSKQIFGFSPERPRCSHCAYSFRPHLCDYSIPARPELIGMVQFTRNRSWRIMCISVAKRQNANLACHTRKTDNEATSPKKSIQAHPQPDLHSCLAVADKPSKPGNNLDFLEWAAGWPSNSLQEHLGRSLAWTGMQK